MMGKGIATTIMSLVVGILANANPTIKGFTLLSDNFDEGMKAIEIAGEYGINHLQLSHNIIMDLCEVNEDDKAELVNRFITVAHDKGIREVVVWDHCLYKMDYYPSKFKIKEDGRSKLDFDNPEFWEWLKNDYRRMLSKLPEVDGLVLTFIETGARAEKQISEKMKTGPEKLAAVIKAVSQVVCDELGKKLYLRTFAYTKDEYATLRKCMNLVPESDKIILMMKETPHDFFLMHPDNPLVGTINRPTIIEFDATGEFHGQCIIAGMIPGKIAGRWRNHMQRPQVVGYVARTDRYGDTQIVGTPAEVNLYALKRVTEEPAATDERILEEFLEKHYGAEAVAALKPVFESTYDILTSSMYILGLNMARHSEMSFDNVSIYSRHVSGRWNDNPEIHIAHDINRDFHYWKDIVDHLAPVECKKLKGKYAKELKEVLAREWTEPEERMTEEYLDYILKEYAYALRLTEKNIKTIRSIRNILPPSAYEQLYSLFERTSMTIRLRSAAAEIYWGRRINSEKAVNAGKARLLPVISEYDLYSKQYPVGQWDWKNDVALARMLLVK